MSRFVKALKDPGKAYKYIRQNVSPIHVLENPYLFVTSRYPVGTHVLERDWDVLILLDTCRVDALQKVSGDYDFVNGVDSIRSLGGTSPEWMGHTFDKKYEEELSDVAYITSNPNAETVLEDREIREEHPAAARRYFRYGKWDPVDVQDLGFYDPVYSYQSNVDLEGVAQINNVTPPRYITDRAISVARSKSPKRMILHYMQPHYPWVSRALQENRELEDWEQRPEQIKSFSREKVFNSYLSDLRYVLDDIDLLLKNIDADTVAISSDHGDAFGEWGVFGHGPGRFHPKVRRVPWALTTAFDSGEYKPQIEPPQSNSSNVGDQLDALGYK